MPTKDLTDRRVSPWPEITVGFWVVVFSGLAIIGADLMWAVALGDLARDTWSVPVGVPFASAAQADWPNPMVMAQVLLSLVHAAGWWALPALQLGLVAATLAVVVVEGRRMGGTDARISVAVSLVAVGAASALVVVRYPTLSLLPFVLLVAVLRRQDDNPGRRLWLVPPLMIVWGNLHGAVLVGLAVLGAYVVAARGPRLRDRLLVGLASLACLVLTSAGLRTPWYYVSALGNEAAARGTDLWARPDLTQPLDVVLVLAGVALLALAARSLRAWEWVVTLGLVVATVTAARHGVWLLLFLAPVAALPRGRRVLEVSPADHEPRRWPTRALAVVTVVSVVVVGWQLARRSEQVRPPGHALVARVAELAGESPVLATEPAVETLAQAGIRVWAANPIDAFTREVQGQFLDFLHDCTVPDASITVAVVDRHCRSVLLTSGWTEASSEGDVWVLTRSAP